MFKRPVKAKVFLVVAAVLVAFCVAAVGYRYFQEQRQLQNDVEFVSVGFDVKVVDSTGNVKSSVDAEPTQQVFRLETLSFYLSSPALGKVVAEGNDKIVVTPKIKVTWDVQPPGIPVYFNIHAKREIYFAGSLLESPQEYSENTIQLPSGQEYSLGQLTATTYASTIDNKLKVGEEQQLVYKYTITVQMCTDSTVIAEKTVEAACTLTCSKVVTGTLTVEVSATADYQAEGGL